MVFPWQRYDGGYTSGWDNPAKKKPAKKAAAKKASAKKQPRKPKRGR